MSAGDGGIKRSYLLTVLTFSCAVVCITELLSIFNQLTYIGLLVSWSSLAAFLLIFFFSKVSIGLMRFQSGLHKAALGFRDSSLFKKAIIFSLSVLLSLVLVQGIIYPPNNSDSMTYHMPRIVIWMSQSSVGHYPTSIARQLYQPPFAEFMITQVNILTSSDTFSSMVQLFFLVSCLAPILLISTEFLSLSRTLTVIVSALTLTIPMALLQGSNTKSDLVLSFFVMSAVYFTFSSIHSKQRPNYLFIGISFGLAMLTRGTSYIFLTPVGILLIWDIALRLFKHKQIDAIYHATTAGMICLLINAGHFSRNYQLAGHPFGMDPAESKTYSNEQMSPKLLVSNLTKNLSRQMGPYPVNKIYDRFLEKLHQWMHLPMNNPWTHYRNMEYRGAPSTYDYEETTPNFMHLHVFLVCLFLLPILYCTRKPPPRHTLILLGIILLQSILFSALLRWQPWHSRLLVPVFMLTALFTASILASYRLKRTVALLLVVPFIIFGFYVVITNRMRPLWIRDEQKQRLFTEGAFARQFMGADRKKFEEYRAVREGMSPVQNLDLGLLFNNNVLIYNLLRDTYDSSIHPTFLLLDKDSNIIKKPGYQPGCIISNQFNRPSIYLDGRTFTNATPQNKSIWLYKAMPLAEGQ